MSVLHQATTQPLRHGESPEELCQNGVTGLSKSERVPQTPGVSPSAVEEFSVAGAEGTGEDELAADPSLVKRSTVEDTIGANKNMANSAVAAAWPH